MHRPRRGHLSIAPDDPDFCGSAIKGLVNRPQCDHSINMTCTEQLLRAALARQSLPTVGTW